MSAPGERQAAEKVAQVSQDAVPAPQGEGSAGSGKEVPSTLNEAGTLKPDGDKSAREGEQWRRLGCTTVSEAVCIPSYESGPALCALP